MKKPVIAVLAVLGLASSLAAAALELNAMFTDNMVLQRNPQVPVWGTADPGVEVTVEFAGQKKLATAKPDGSWLIHLKPMKASSPPPKILDYVFGATLKQTSAGLYNHELKVEFFAIGEEIDDVNKRTAEAYKNKK